MEVKRNNQAAEPADSDLSGDQSQADRVLRFPKLLLASASPRRAEILRTVGWPFEVLAVDVDESRRAGENAVTYVGRLALAKAETAASRSPESIIVGADTVVMIHDQILGKPRNEDDARRMLRLLSGQWHLVLTGVAVLAHHAVKSRTGHEKTEVKFAPLSDDEIDWYVTSGEPMDKAGAYAIQGLGARFIEEIRGDYYNVVGLPVRLLYEMVREIENRKSKNRK
jgi:septum formation protein